MSENVRPMVSPCVKVCVIDAEKGLCHGCRRTLEEVAMWSRYSDAERAAVMAQLPERAAT